MDWIRRGLLVLSVVALVGACGDDESPEPTTTTAESTTTSEATTTTAPPPDPSVIPADPADIDEAYVEAVLAELFQVDGEVLSHDAMERRPKSSRRAHSRRSTPPSRRMTRQSSGRSHRERIRGLADTARRRRR